MNISRLIAAGGLALALLLGSGCSDGTEPAAAPTSSPAAGPSSPAPTSATSPDATSPTSRPAGTTAGSTDLTDGRHAARITRVDAAGGRVTVDVVQFFLGDAAARAAQEDDAEEVPPPNDVWIRNASRALRTLPVAPASPITVNVHGAAESGSATKNIAKSLAELADIDGLENGIFWFTVADGRVTRIAEQYLP